MSKAATFIARSVEHYERAITEFEAQSACIQQALAADRTIIGRVVRLKDGKRVQLVDNFKTDQVTVWRSARFPRYEVKEVKEPKTKKEKK